MVMARLAFALAVCLTQLLSPADGAISCPPHLKRAVVLFVGVGVGKQQIESAGFVNSGFPLGRLFMDRLPFKGSLNVSSASFDSEPDSAAVGTAMACGVQTNNKYLGVSANGTRCVSLLEIAKNQGWSTGVVSNEVLVRPAAAAFLVNSTPPHTAASIAAHIPNDYVDVLLGQTGPNLVSEVPAFERLGYTYVADAAALAAVNSTTSRLLGLFTVVNGPVAAEDVGKNVDLATMTIAAISLLAAKGESFFLLVTGGSEKGDATLESMLLGTIALDRAVASVYDNFYNQCQANVLLLVAGNHESGKLSISSYGNLETLPVPDPDLPSTFKARQKARILDLANWASVSPSGNAAWPTSIYSTSALPASLFVPEAAATAAAETGRGVTHDPRDIFGAVRRLIEEKPASPLTGTPLLSKSLDDTCSLVTCARDTDCQGRAACVAMLFGDPRGPPDSNGVVFGVCQAPTNKPTGSLCRTGKNTTNFDGKCKLGACVAACGGACVAASCYTKGRCDAATDKCVDTRPLIDGAFCTQVPGGTCRGGKCSNSCTGVVCSGSQCRAPGVCSVEAGRCMPGLPLSDGRNCTTLAGKSGRCRSGTCTNPCDGIVCSTPAHPDCSLNLCDPEFGACVNLPVADRTPCGEDSVHGGGICSGGVCKVGSVVGGTAAKDGSSLQGRQPTNVAAWVVPLVLIGALLLAIAGFIFWRRRRLAAARARSLHQAMHFDNPNSMPGLQL